MTQLLGTVTVVVFVQAVAAITPVAESGAGIAWALPGKLPSWTIRRAPIPPYQPVRKMSMLTFASFVVMKKTPPAL